MIIISGKISVFGSLMIILAKNEVVLFQVKRVTKINIKQIIIQIKVLLFFIGIIPNNILTKILVSVQYGQHIICKYLLYLTKMC